jgi:hypothetical protein
MEKIFRIVKTLRKSDGSIESYSTIVLPNVSNNGSTVGLSA